MNKIRNITPSELNELKTEGDEKNIKVQKL